MALTLDEIIDGLNHLAADDREKAKEVASAIRERAKPVAQMLINVGGALKKEEAKADVRKATERAEKAEADLQAAQDELNELKSKAPDAKAIEDRLTASHAKALKKEQERADAAERRAKELNRRIARDITHAELIKPDASGVYVEPEYAELVLGRYDDRYVDKDDGSLGVLQVGEATEYDGQDVKAKAAALAKDIRKQIQPRYLITSADSGAGVRSGNGGGNSTTKTVEQIKQEKLNNPAFSGL